MSRIVRNRDIAPWRLETVTLFRLNWVNSDDLAAGTPLYDAEGIAPDSDVGRSMGRHNWDQLRSPSDSQ